LSEARAFSEKKEAYVGLLDAYHKAAIEGTDAAAKNFAYWQIRCELVAPEVVRKAIQGIVDSNDDPAARAFSHDTLTDALRSDLGVQL